MTRPPLTPPDTLTLHIGLHKTGTSMIQRTMRRLRSELYQHGIVYVDRRDMQSMEHLPGWSAFPQTQPDDRTAFVAELADLVTQRTADCTASGYQPAHVVVSNETLVGSFAPSFSRPFRPRAESAIADVVEALQPKSTQLMLYVRRQDSLVESQYLQRIHAGKSLSFDRFLNRFEAGPIMDYLDLVKRLEQLPTVTNVWTRPFEIIAAGAAPFLQDFLGNFDAGQVDLAKAGRIRNVNPSYTAPALAVVMRLNRRNSARFPKTAIRTKRATRWMLKRRYPAGRYPSPVLFTEKRRRDFLAMYDTVNRRFFTERHPELPDDVYSTPQMAAGLRDYLRVPPLSE